MTAPDPRRAAAIARARNDLGLLVVAVRSYATVPPETVRAALDDLPGADRITLAQLAVLADECGLRLRLDVTSA